MAKVKILLTALAVTWLLSLPVALSTASPVTATPDEAKWSRVNIPAEGQAGNWVLARGSDIQRLTLAADGTLYSYANPSGTSDTLFRSTDAGNSWSASGRVKEAIAALVTAPDDASIIYYATASNVYSSADAGTSFTLWLLKPGGAGSGNITITSMAVARRDSQSITAVGTRDSDSSQYGGVYILDENQPLTGWINTNIGNYDVLALAFSPNYAADRQLVAVVTDEQDTIVTTRIGDGDWGRIIGNARIGGLAPRAAAIAFPDDYDATTEDYALFVAIDSGSDNGDVYRIYGSLAPDGSVATDLNIGSAYNRSSVDVSGLAVSGNTTAASLLAGVANSAQVYISTDSGLNWARSKKEPTGQSRTCVLMAGDFSRSRRAYAATSGNESAFAYTSDGGVTWNQVSLIDTTLSNIVDLAPSPNYGQDNTLLMLTFDEGHLEHSLWRSLNGGAKWERVFTSTLANADSLKLVELSQQYGRGSQVIYLAGIRSSHSVIWQSDNNGQTFKRRGSPFPVDIWAVVNDDTLLVGSYDGSNGLVYRTTNGGFSYSSGAIVGSQPLKSLALSPGYEQDGTILIGNANGRVYWSNDNATSFEPLPPDATSSPLSGTITVAFDPEFSRNNTVYAASNTADKGIYRFIINKSSKWERIDSTLPNGGMVSQLKVSADGTLYATNAKASGGMERSLNPTYSPGATFETVSRGLDDGATLTGMCLRGNQLWSVDSKNTGLMTYSDILTSPVVLTSPLNKAPGIATGKVILEWARLKGATSYKWQLDYETDFATVPSGFEGDTDASSARLPALEPATTYYWRVRATKPVLSPWSAKWSFTISLGSTVIAPELYSPKAGAEGTPLKPVFQWSAIAGADSYELLVSTAPSLANPVIVKIGDYALPATAWQSDISLDYNTTYYWKVRASGSNSYSAWSAVGAFTTGSPPSQPSPAPEPPTSPPQPSLPQVLVLPPSPPSPPPAQAALPDWVIYLTGALLLTAVLLLITLLVLVVGIRRS